MIHTSARALLPLALLLGATDSLAASPQWSSDPASNLPVATSTSDQAQSLLAPTPDGGVWVSWFDGIGSGWDVRVQKLASDGTEVLGSNGVLVADRTFSSTQGYGLDVTPAGDALLAFRDDRPTGTQITAARVTPSGAQPWGTAGVVATSTSDFVANPKIAGTSDGGAVIAWLQGSAVVLQKLDANGAPQWGPGVTLTAATGSYATADLQSVGNDVILSFVHQTGGFSSPRHLLAQKFDAAGAPQWGTSPLTIFGAGSLQFGNFPSFITDTTGGAIFTWYSSSPALQCFAQRVSAAGITAWATGGVPVATTPGNVRVTPSASYDSATDDVYVAWNELNGAQSQFGIRAQRLSSAGARLWSDKGTVLVANSGLEARMARVVAGGSSGGALVFWSEIPTFGNAQLFGAHVDVSGAVDVPRFDVASTPSGKSRLQAARSTAGFAVLSWGDERTDGGDIYAQNVSFDGGLGSTLTLGINYCGPATANSLGLSGAIRATGTLVAASNNLTLHASNLPPGQFGIFVVANATAMTPVNAGVLCLGGEIGRYQAPTQILQADVHGDFSLALDLTQTPTPNAFVAVMSGDTFYFQAWHRDFDMVGANTANFTDGLQVLFQ